MKTILYYLLCREKIVIIKEGKWVVLKKYEFLLFIWIPVFKIEEEEKDDHLIQEQIEDLIMQNPKIKIIDKRPAYFNL